MKNSKNVRIQKFDIARTFAILCVVLCHCVENAYPNVRYSQVNAGLQMAKCILFTIGRLGVPIFLFLTGALILKKQIEEDSDIKQFYKKNLLPIFITTEIWIVLYNIFIAILNQQFSIKSFLKDIFFLKQIGMPNMWYMPMILGMYLAIPFVAKIVKTFSLETMKIPMIICFIFSFIMPSVNVLLRTLKLEQYWTVLDLSFLGGIYGLYILLGYYINNGLLKKYSKTFLVIIAANCFIITSVFQYITNQARIYYNVWYDFVLLFICTACIFELFTRIKEMDNKNIFIKLTEYISKISLGIFFMHEIFLSIFWRCIRQAPISDFLECMILFVSSTICSIIFIKLTSKIKFMKEKIFLIKE